MKKVLIFTYYWPPGSNPGVLRILKTCKYLPEFGWKPYIVTVKDGSYPSVDRSLSDTIPEDTEVFHTTSIEPFRIYNLLSGKSGNSSPVGMANIKDSRSLIQRLSLWIRANLFIPDARMGWWPFAARKGAELIRSEKIDAIITTGPPHSTHLAGLKLKKKFNVPWVADMRDPWTTIYYNKFLPRSPFTERKDKRLERKVIVNADAVTTVSEGLEREFESLNSNIKLIYNGFDEADFTEMISYKKRSRFRIAFFGNLLPNQDVPALWEAISELVSEDEDFSESLELAFAGNAHEVILDNIRSAGLASHLKKYPYMPHGEAVIEMKKTEMLLFIIPDCADNHLILTGKLFEYLASGSPLLSIGPEDGNAARVLTETGRDVMSDYRDKDRMKEQIVRYFTIWKSDEDYVRFGLDDRVKFYSRRKQTERLAEVLAGVTV